MYDDDDDEDEEVYEEDSDQEEDASNELKSNELNGEEEEDAAAEGEDGEEEEEEEDEEESGIEDDEEEDDSELDFFSSSPEVRYSHIYQTILGIQIMYINFYFSQQPGFDSGCTAVVALIHGDDLYVANAGDSRCVVSKNGVAVDMSEDHKPEDPAEFERITKAGGKVTADGRVNGGLNLSRAIGK